MTLKSRDGEVWMYTDSNGRSVAAVIHEIVGPMHHSATVYFTDDERLWSLGAQQWAENAVDYWESDSQFRRLYP